MTKHCLYGLYFLVWRELNMLREGQSVHIEIQPTSLCLSYVTIMSAQAHSVKRLESAMIMIAINTVL